MTSGISSALVVNILLTLLGWVPGIIHAIWYLQKTEERRGAY
nr:YqaE/Pmp3 family membrane protein [Leptolyngbya boryana]